MLKHHSLFIPSLLVLDVPTFNLYTRLNLMMLKQSFFIPSLLVFRVPTFNLYTRLNL